MCNGKFFTLKSELFFLVIINDTLVVIICNIDQSVGIFILVRSQIHWDHYVCALQNVEDSQTGYI